MNRVQRDEENSWALVVNVLAQVVGRVGYVCGSWG